MSPALIVPLQAFAFSLLGFLVQHSFQHNIWKLHYYTWTLMDNIYLTWYLPHTMGLLHFPHKTCLFMACLVFLTSVVQFHLEFACLDNLLPTDFAMEGLLRRWVALLIVFWTTLGTTFTLGLQFQFNMQSVSNFHQYKNCKYIWSLILSKNRLHRSSYFSIWGRIYDN